MAWVITRMCRDCVDMACVEVCPVDCIVQHKEKKDAAGYENQLYIDPEECINCGVCEPECPLEAILPDTDDQSTSWIALNAEYSEKWPNITQKGQVPPDEADFRGVNGKFDEHFSKNPGGS